jgi:ATP-dependent Lon protease
LDILELGNKIQSQVKGDMDKSQREYYLRQQLKAIKEELGEKDEASVEIDEYRAKIDEKNLPEEALKEADRELERLSRMHPSSAEYTVASTYLDWITSLPWHESSPDNLDIKKARKILDDDHFGLEKPKKRIIEYLAVRKLKPESKGPILCFAGPPGTGKTSLGQSIARALGRKFHRISLGGVRDEAEIRGHRRTYVGALPGRIIQGLRRAETNNPIFMLDEIDKVGSDFRGDPSSALLEVLDPEQNFSFSDHYLDVPFDLSKVMFITTANILDTIPPALRDRMEVLMLHGYTLDEKVKIANRYLIPRQREAHGIKAKQIKFTNGAVKQIVMGYTREAGLRNLEREIANVCRGVATKIAQGKVKSVSIKVDDLHEYLGPVRLTSETKARITTPGVATGLAWTPTGGELLFIEATAMKGSKGLTLTGQLGDVMKESATAALSFARSNAKDLGLDEDFFAKHDIHIHVPAGAIPKDGPSAGVTMLTALTSLLTDTRIRKDLAMTGEITLRGQVLPVGGIKEKVLAAHRAGIKTIILPELNRKDIEGLPKKVQKDIRFHCVNKMLDVLEIALDKKKTRKAVKRRKKK